MTFHLTFDLTRLRFSTLFNDFQITLLPFNLTQLYDMVQTTGNVPTSQTELLLPFSGLKRHPEGGNSKFLLSVGKFLLKYTVSHFRRR